MTTQSAYPFDSDAMPTLDAGGVQGLSHGHIAPSGALEAPGGPESAVPAPPASAFGTESGTGSGTGLGIGLAAGPSDLPPTPGSFGASQPSGSSGFSDSRDPAGAARGDFP